MILYATLLFLVLLILIVSWVVYNKLIAARESIQEALSGIDVQLKKRFELIPKLVDIVKAYSNYEAETFKKLTAIRSNKKDDIVQKEKEDAGLNLISRSIKVSYENYPELKANEQFASLMNELSKVEDELAMSRRYMNGTVRDYNTKIGVFPNFIFAKLFHFNEHTFYEIESFEREPHKIFE